MNFKVEDILIPESYVRMSMVTTEFDEFLISNFSDYGNEAIIYVYKGARYLFHDEGFVIEELIK